MRIVFMGSPEFAVTPLRALHDEGYQVVAVVTQPDKRGNRGLPQPTPVKRQALEFGYPVLEPRRVRDADSVAAIRALAPDLLVVVAYGQILSQELLDIPRLGAVNIHGSLLPKYRGAAPIHWAVINGELQTGVSLMYLDAGMDSGDVIATKVSAIGGADTTSLVRERLCWQGTLVLLDQLPAIAAGTANRTPQDPAQATYAPRLTHELELVDWRKPAFAVYNLIRGLNDDPGCYTLFQGKRVKLRSGNLALPPRGADPCPQARPGQIVALSADGIWVRCGDGNAYRIGLVQPEGKGPMDAASFARGRRLVVGDGFDPLPDDKKQA